MLRGNVNYNLGLHNKALLDYKNAEKLNNNHSSLFFLKATNYFSLSSLSRALEEIKKAIKIEPNNKEYQDYKILLENEISIEIDENKQLETFNSLCKEGKIRAEQGDLKSSISKYISAIKIMPDMSEGYLGVGLSQLLLYNINKFSIISI